MDPDVLKCFDNPAAARQYLLETNDLNKNHDKFFENNADAYAVETTSGTTGKAFPVVKSAAERFVAANYLLKCRKEHFPAANIKNGFLLAHEVDDYLRNTNYLHEKCDMHEVVDYFIDKKPKWIFVTANTIKRFSNAITNFNKGDEVRKLGVQFIEVTAATLLDEDKDRIEELFNAPIRNQYGCREVWNIAYECKCGRMHINDSCLMVDLVDEKGNIIDEENVVGDVIVTSLYNKMTPFVKYYLGDYASISYEECECGKKTPILMYYGTNPLFLDKNRPRKVVFYGRVSTEHEAQLSALENQMQWYEDTAKRFPNWEVVGRYIDEGITGTHCFHHLRGNRTDTKNE